MLILLAAALACASLIAVTLPPAVAVLVLPVVLVIWSGAGWAGHPSQMSRLAAMAPDAAVVALSLNASALYVGIAAGAALGQQVLRHGASWQLGFVGAACELGALALLLIAARRRRAARSEADRVAPSRSRRPCGETGRRAHGPAPCPGGRSLCRAGAPAQALTSKTMLNGVSVARRKRLKPASSATLRSRISPACAPSPSPTSCDSEAGVQIIVDAP